MGWEGAGSIPGELLHFQLFFLKLQLCAWFQSHLDVGRIRDPLSGSPFSGFLLHFPVMAVNPDPVLQVFSSEGM